MKRNKVNFLDHSSHPKNWISHLQNLSLALIRFWTFTNLRYLVCLLNLFSPSLLNLLSTYNVFSQFFLSSHSSFFFFFLILFLSFFPRFLSLFFFFLRFLSILFSFFFLFHLIIRFFISVIIFLFFSSFLNYFFLSSLSFCRFSFFLLFLSFVIFLWFSAGVVEYVNWISAEGKTYPTTRVQGMTPNYWGAGALKNVEYPFIAINPWFILTLIGCISLGPIYGSKRINLTILTILTILGTI